jgi:hypothetical protein
LIELLVALTIFTTVLAGVTLMFNNAVRVSKQGYQNQEAYSMARGVANRIEADLTSAYTALEHGLGDTFYGSPIGFTFIGKIKTGEGVDDFDLARISYVIYTGPNNFGKDPLTKYYEEATLTEQEFQDEFDQGRGDGRRETYSLIRFVEPGVDTLDTFPVNWSSQATGEGLSFDAIIGSAKDVLFPPFGYDISLDYSIVGLSQRFDGPCASGDFNCAEAVEKSARREYWLRLLSGDPNLSYKLWETPQMTGKEPEDYVIAEDLLHIARMENYVPNDRDTIIYVTDPVVNNTSTNPLAAFLSPNHIAPIIYSSNLYEAYQPDFQTQTKYSSTNYFFAYRATGTTDRIDEFGQKIIARGLLGGAIIDPTPVPDDHTLYEQEVRGVDFAYWNDFRNLISKRITGFSNGTPTEGRLPEAIISELTVFLPSAYQGAPDFQRTFVQQIDSPAGYRRTIPTSKQEARRNLDRQTLEILSDN